MFYRVNDNRLIDYADYKYNEACLETDIVTKEELDNDRLLVIVDDGELIPNPNYEEEKQEQEAERVSHLKCTKRVLALMLQQLGISYQSLKDLIATNEQAQLEWDLCVELERSNPLLDIMGSQLGLSSEQIDLMFKYANGEVEVLEAE